MPPLSPKISRFPGTPLNGKASFGALFLCLNTKFYPLNEKSYTFFAYIIFFSYLCSPNRIRMRKWIRMVVFLPVLLAVLPMLLVSCRGAEGERQEAEMNRFIDELMTRMTLEEKLTSVRVGWAACLISKVLLSFARSSA